MPELKFRCVNHRCRSKNECLRYRTAREDIRASVCEPKADLARCREFLRIGDNDKVKEVAK